MKIKYVSWDSLVFNKPVFEIENDDNFDKTELEVIDKKCCSNNAFMSFIKINTLDFEKIHFLESLGYNYMESQFSLKKTITNPYPQLPLNRHFKIQKFDCNNEQSLHSIMEIISTSFDTDRYYLDPKLDKKYSGIRYKNWFLNSYNNNDFETYVCISKKDDKIVAFTLIKKENTEIDLLLSSVKKELKGFGIFPVFFSDLINYLFYQEYKTFLTSISSHNLEIMNIYIHFGFCVVDEKIVLRKIYS